MGGEPKVLLIRFFISLLLSIFFLLNPLPSSCASPQELFQVGIGAFKDGFFQVAEAQFREFLKTYPQHPYALHVMYLLGKTLYEQNKFIEAKETLVVLLNSKKEFKGRDAAYFWLARSYEKLEDLFNAQNNLLIIIKRHHQSDWYLSSLALLGKISFKEGKYKSSESYLRKALEDRRITYPLSASVRFWLGLCFYEQGDYKDAEEMLEEVIKSNVKELSHEEALYWLGEVQIKLEKYKEGAETFNSFLREFPQSSLAPNALYGECWCLFLIGKKEKALQGLLALWKGFPHAPLLSQVLSLTGEIYISLERNQEAISVFKEFLSRFPQDRIKGKVLLNLAWCYLRLGDLSQVKQIAYEIVKLPPGDRENVLAQYILAEVNSYEGKCREAMPYWFNILTTPSYRQEALFKIALCSFKEEKFKDSLTNLELLQLEYPSFKNMDEVLWIQGESFREFGNLSEANKVYLRVVKEYKNSLWYPWCIYRLITMYLENYETKEAEKFFDTLHKEFSKHEVYYEAALHLGIKKAEKVEYKSSLWYLDIAIHSLNRRVVNNALFWQGEIYFNLKEYQKALNCYQNILAVLPSAGDTMAAMAYLEIGNIRHLLGNNEEAKASYKKAIEISDNEGFNEKVKELLKKLEFFKKENVQ